MALHCCVCAQALNEAKASDLMFWASSYNLFVHWSTNRSHPWDKLPKANSAACTLEIGKLRDSDNEVCCSRHLSLPCISLSFSLGGF